ncbi:ATP-binding protein [Cetobacterium sp. 8H]|uniref:sensor histidine kinase n=1 Tax=Cetobacterium sp. 8H TaxID=2759681 RepID=UPI00163C5357|nr:sensor histidine kinase [Cetobacterium sp. 8H]MBC2851426.1 ATP-binding protein [Cetobacterium sp. 8H]
MKIRKDSLLVKIIFYNDIAIFLTSILIAMVVVITSFQDMEQRIEDTTKNKLNLLIGNYKSYFGEIRNDVYKEIGKHKISDGNQKVAETLKDNLLKDDFKSYYNAVVSILSSDGVLLGEYGNEGDLGTLTDENIHILLENAKKREFEQSGYYLADIKDRIYSRTIIPYGNEKTTYYVVISTPINEEFLKSLKEGLDLTSKDKILFLSNDTLKNENQAQKFFPPKTYKEISKKDYRNYYLNKKIDGLSYYLGVYNLIGYNDTYLGNFIVALSKEKLTEEKLMTSVYIGILVLFIMILSSTISNKVFRKLLLPLSEIADLADKISNGEKVDDIKIEGQGEIRTLSISFKEMVEKLNIAQDDLTIQNQELVRNIERIEAIDKLLMGINIEKDTFETIKKLVSGFTSEVGLGYSRAMYFRYSRENDYLIGEEVSINRTLNENSKKGFKFQVKNLKELVFFTKVPINDENLLARSFKEQKIIYKNDAGYKYDLGNDLLKAIGLKNFFIFPIHGAGKFSGVIVVDNYTKDIRINQEELELLNLLAINFSVGINNKETTANTLESQRVLTIEKLATRFLRIRGEVVEKLLKCIDSENPGERIIEELSEIKPYLIRIKEDNESLKAYSEQNGEKKERLCLDKLINEIIESHKKRFKDENISISFFSATNGTILGDKLKFEKVVKELLENSYNALLKRKQNRRINIILSKRKINEKIELKIIDNGIGMSSKQLEDIYEPFISYQPQTLGLGLFFVHKIIKDHGGVIKHFSEEGKSTEVKITLNAYKEEV